MDAILPRRLCEDLLLLGIFAALIFVAHFLVGNGYGFHRDELQFIDDGRHLHWGFVAYPPLTAFAARIAILGGNITPASVRLAAAIVNAVSLVLIGLIARELGARRIGLALTAIAALPLTLAFSVFLQYNTFDLLAWTVTVLFTARLLRTEDPRHWLGVGLGIGIGVESKYSIAFLAVSLLMAFLILPSQRHLLRSRWFVYGIAVAALIAAPNLLWLTRHHFITLQMEHFIHARDVRHGRADGFYTDQVKYTMFAFPLAMAGLLSLLRSPRLRLLSAVYLGPLLCFILLKGRGYYLLPAYPVLFAAGAVAVERSFAARPAWLRLSFRSVVAAALLLDIAAMTFAYLPVWKPYSAGWNWQMKNNGDSAEEVGWPEFVAQVAEVRDALPPEDRASLAVLANNYGEAGALALYGPKYGLPTPISSTNSFHDRGWGPFDAETVIVTGGDLDDQLTNFKTCRIAAKVHMPYGVRNEESRDHPDILVCHHILVPWPLRWAHSQEFG
jgi:4-amino-4-deoxy-L-arabinose transferase-like glycosyltransferase